MTTTTDHRSPTAYRLAILGGSVAAAEGQGKRILSARFSRVLHAGGGLKCGFRPPASSISHGRTRGIRCGCPVVRAERTGPVQPPLTQVPDCT